MSDTKFLTKEWFEKLKNELDQLKKIKLPSVLARLKDAIWQWDISENSEYETAMAEKDLIENRIVELESMLSDVQIIEWTARSSDIRYWSIVVLQDEKWKEQEFTLVWWGEVDILNWTISFDCPIWVAIKWKKKWDKVNVRAPKWKYEIEILDVK